MHPSQQEWLHSCTWQWIWTTNVGHFSGADSLTPSGQGGLDFRVDPDSWDFDNNTPVHIAKQNNCLEIVNALTEAGTRWTPPVPSRIRPARCFMRNVGQDHHSALQLRDPTVPCGLHPGQQQDPLQGLHSLRAGGFPPAVLKVVREENPGRAGPAPVPALSEDLFWWLETGEELTGPPRSPPLIMERGKNQ